MVAEEDAVANKGPKAGVYVVKKSPKNWPKNWLAGLTPHATYNYRTKNNHNIDFRQKCPNPSMT
jgi:hypothetical protein